MSTKYEAFEGTGYEVQTFYGARWACQTFTAIANHDVKSITMMCGRSGSPGSGYIYIYATSGGKPTGSPLATVSVNWNSIATSSEWNSFSFSSYADLIDGQLYALVATAPSGNSSNRINWVDNASNAYSGGTRVTSADSGANWTVDSTRDYLFRIYGDEAEINIKQGSNSIASGGSYDFGNVTVGSSKAVTFTIENTGAAKLNLLGDPMVDVSGANPDDFEVTEVPSSPVSPSSSTTFEITFTPSAYSDLSATITILNNDDNESTYTIDLTGAGTHVIPLGWPAVDRTSELSIIDDTIVTPLVSADRGGIVTKVQVYVSRIYHDGQNMSVGIFYVTQPAVYPSNVVKLKCRSAAVLGVPVEGLNTWEDLNLACEDGDMIGIYWYTDAYGGFIELDGGSPLYTTAGVNACVEGLESTFYNGGYDMSHNLIYFNWKVSVYGEGVSNTTAKNTLPLYNGGLKANKRLARMGGW